MKCHTPQSKSIKKTHVEVYRFMQSFTSASIVKRTAPDSVWSFPTQTQQSKKKLQLPLVFKLSVSK